MKPEVSSSNGSGVDHKGIQGIVDANMKDFTTFCKGKEKSEVELEMMMKDGVLEGFRKEHPSLPWTQVLAVCLGLIATSAG